VIAVLYVVGGAIELAGIALVAWDVLESQRKVREMSDPGWHSQPGPEHEGSLFSLMALVAAGNVRRRAFGVGLFAAGLIVQTVGNLASL
jgi:hypothetical protein